MKNLYSTPLNYTNFAGVKKSTTLHFHVTPREFADWMIDHKDQADQLVAAFTEVQDQVEGNPDGQASTEQKYTMLKMVRILAEMSYGKPDEDGEVFDKSGLGKFIHSAAYDSFRMFLFENPNELVTFINTLLNEETISEFGKSMQGLAEANGTAQPAVAPAAPKKNPRDMTHEELIAAFEQKNK